MVRRFLSRLAITHGRSNDRLTGLRRILILSPSPASWPHKSGRETAGTRENACVNKQFTQVGSIPGLIGGSAYKGLRCYKWPREPVVSRRWSSIHACVNHRNI
jgi:hypothetical protein